MASPPSRKVRLLFGFFLVSLCAAAAALDKVPVKSRFRFVNDGASVDYPAEYNADYRPVDVVGSPFQLAFYNTTPNAFTLAIRMGTPRSNSLRRWIWEANRGRPVRDNATLTFGADGDLVLADADGTLVWSTGTANRGVVGIRILHGGNMVLHDKKGRFLWESFDYPTDTLLVGRSLPARGGATRLVSRKSDVENSPGIYSLVVDHEEPILYVDASPKPLVYYNRSRDFGSSPLPTNDPLQFTCVPNEGNVSYQLSFGSLTTATKYDSTLSFLWLTVDGDVVFYTYDDRVDSRAWEKSYSLFDAEHTSFLTACDRPGKCGALGVCDGEMCTACPTAKGSTGWTPSCAPPRRGACRAGASPSYYKVAGIEHFLNRDAGEGVVSVGECRRRCNADCNCLGFLYWEESSRCWLAPVLGTLKKVTEPRHVIYIKSS